jgi:pyruvate/2-oxoglutarate dehydrogenase complex dihydrolipoamide dehydrogenase (E3) component
MTNLDSWDVVIIGAGQAGIPLAHGLAKAGRRVALVERKHLGGSCINFGCTPTKAAIASARVAHLARRSSDFGVAVGRVEVDFVKVIARANDIARQSRAHLDGAFPPGGNPELIRGEARFVGRKGQGFEIAIGERRIQTGRVVLDTGTRARIPQVSGLDPARLLHSENWLERSTLPEALLVIGGGAIGLEMAQFYRRMGSRVTIIESGSQIAPSEDEDVARPIAKMLESEGIAIELGANISAVEYSRAGVKMSIERDGRKHAIEGTDIFVAVGRTPNTDALGLDTVGVERDPHGFIKVNDRLHTNVPGVFAAGDIRGGPMFTHTAWDDHRILLPALGLQPRAAQLDAERTTDRITPYAIFTDPELGRVGATERQLKAAAQSVRVARYDLANNSKAFEIGETVGLIKVIADPRTDLILGAAVLAPHGGELVHIFVDAMNARASVSKIANSVYIHPTLAEAVQSAVEKLKEGD